MFIAPSIRTWAFLWPLWTANDHVLGPLQVVDTPGFCDKKRPDEEISQTIAQFLSGVSPGPHAVLVVMKASERYNSDMDRAYSEAKKLLGGEGLASRIILIFTCGDILKEKKVNIESQIKQFFEDSGQMMRDARQRYIVFNNNATGKENEDQLNRLLKLVRSVDADFLSSLTQQKIEEIINNESTKLSKNKNITIEEARYQVRKEMAESAGSNKKVFAAITSVKESVQTHKVDLHISCTIL